LAQDRAIFAMSVWWLPITRNQTYNLISYLPRIMINSFGIISSLPAINFIDFSDVAPSNL